MTTKILIHELSLMLENLVLILNKYYLEKFIVRVSTKTLRIHLRWHWIPNYLRLTSQVLGKSVDLTLLVLLLLVTMIQEVELMMKVITLEMMVEMLGNNNKVNIQWAHSLVKRISCIAHNMKTMALEELV